MSASYRGRSLLIEKAKSSRQSYGRSRRACQECGRIGCAGVDAAVALVARHGAAILRRLCVAGAAGVALHVAAEVRAGLLRCPPRRDEPGDAGEAFELEALALPLPARLAGPVERAEAGVDGTLVCLGSQLVTGCGCCSCDGELVSSCVDDFALPRRNAVST